MIWFEIILPILWIVTFPFIDDVLWRMIAFNFINDVQFIELFCCNMKKSLYNPEDTTA